MNHSQRVVVVIALGLVLLTAAWTLDRVLWDPTDSGWFAYAPNTGALMDGVDPDAQAVREGGVYLAATLVWAASGVALLRRSPAAGDGEANL